MRSARGCQGFTLIELLVVVAIIAVLGAIAIPQFLGRQSKAFDARVMTDIRSAAMGEEAYFDDNGSYFEGTCGGLPGVALSPGVACDAVRTGQGYQITAQHPQGSKTCVWSTDTVPTLVCS